MLVFPTRSWVPFGQELWLTLQTPSTMPKEKKNFTNWYWIEVSKCTKEFEEEANIRLTSSCSLRRLTLTYSSPHRLVISKHKTQYHLLKDRPVRANRAVCTVRGGGGSWSSAVQYRGKTEIRRNNAFSLSFAPLFSPILPPSLSSCAASPLDKDKH